MGGLYNDLDPNGIVDYEDYGLLDEVLPVPSQKSHHVEDSYAQDPDDFVGYEDVDQYDDVLHVPSKKSHHLKDSYAQDPDDFVDYEDFDYYDGVLPVKPAKAGKNRKARPRKIPNGQADDQNERPRPVIDHNEQVQRLIECMPHLKQLQTYSSRIPLSGSITRLEYGKDIELPRRKSRKTFDSGTWTGSASDSLAKQLGPKSNKPCCLWVLLVEDLSMDLMRALGSQYHVDPEAFAAHISMSGHNKLAYTDLPESRWSTAKTKKSYRSIKWFRPVRLGSRVLSWLQNPEDLIKLEGHGIESTETSYERRGNVLVERKTKHHVKLDTNTFRQTRPLSTRPLDFSKDSVPAVWEERATVFLSTERKLHTS
jgi:hypothetical protein